MVCEKAFGQETSAECYPSTGEHDYVRYLFNSLPHMPILGSSSGAVRGREVERRPRNHEVPSSSPGSGSQLWDFSLAHTFGASTDVVPRKQNRKRLV